MPANPASVGDPYGLRKFERSRAQTQKGYTRLANSIMRDAIGNPLTRQQRAEIKAQQPRPDEKQVDKNCYRAPLIRQRSPREMKNRRKPGWTDCNFVLPLVTLEGLIHLAKTMADKERWERSSAPLGFRRRYPRTKNFYVLKGLNNVFEEFGMPEFCVQEAEVAPGRVRRFVPPTD